MELLKTVSAFTSRLDTLGLEYFVTGSVAGVIYGEPRVTHDVDIVLRLPEVKIGEFCDAFPIDDFYCPPEEILREEVRRGARGHLNLIAHQTGFRADIYLAQKDPLHVWALANCKRISALEVQLPVAPPEYVIVRKLQFFAEGGSDKHLNDIRGMLRVSASELDIEVARHWAKKLGLSHLIEEHNLF